MLLSPKEFIESLVNNKEAKDSTLEILRKDTGRKRTKYGYFRCKWR